MKAVRIHSYGGSELLTYEEVAIPEPGDNDVLIHVRAASINPVDVAFRAGYMSSFIPLTFPATLGCDVSGTIAALGSGVTGLAIGDEVFARMDLHRLGGYAEYAVVTASEVAHKPARLDFIQAASIPHAGLTAWRALVDSAGLSAGQTVLIHAAAGGVGSLAVQLAKSRGARVIGTAPSKNQAFLAELGVDEALDYTAGPFEEKIKNVDVVFDTVGGETQARSFQTLRPGGSLVSIVQPPSSDIAASFGVRAHMAGGSPPPGPFLNEVSVLVETGQLKTMVSTVLPLSDARRGQELIASGHTRGKIVLEI